MSSEWLAETLDIKAALARRAVDALAEEGVAQAAAARAAARRRLWATVDEAVSTGHPVAAMLECRKAVRAEAEQRADDMELLRATEAWLRPQVEAVLVDLERTLPLALDAAGVALDPSARHPKYTADSGFITVVVDASRLTATIGGRGGPSRREPVDPAGVAAATAALRARLFGRRDSHVTGDGLVRAYRAVVEDEGASPGSEVPIESIRRKLGTKDRQPPADEFNVDLAARVRAASRGDGPRIGLANTRDTKAGYLLHGLEEAGYIGYLKIEGV